MSRRLRAKMLARHRPILVLEVSHRVQAEWAIEFGDRLARHLGRHVIVTVAGNGVDVREMGQT